MQTKLPDVDRRPLPQVPTTQGRTKKKAANEMHGPIDKLNCNKTRPRLPSIILNRSTPRPSPISNSKRAKTAPLHSLYSHSNSSRSLLPSTSRSPPPVLVRPSSALIHRRWPPISLLRSRRKLWKRYWLVVNLPTVPESIAEDVHEIGESTLPRLRSRSEKLISRKPPPSDLPLAPPTTPLMRPSTRIHTPRAMIERVPPPPPPPPELVDDDTGSESSSSDEDLDAYDFDLSCCLPSHAEDSADSPVKPSGIYGNLKDSPLTHHSKTSVHHLEANISSIYESITQRNLALTSSS